AAVTLGVGPEYFERQPRQDGIGIGRCLERREGYPPLDTYASPFTLTFEDLEVGQGWYPGEGISTGAVEEPGASGAGPNLLSGCDRRQGRSALIGAGGIGRIRQRRVARVGGLHLVASGVGGELEC